MKTIKQQEDYAYEDEQGEHTGARLLREVLEVAILTLLFFGVVRLLVQNYRVERWRRPTRPAPDPSS